MSGPHRPRVDTMDWKIRSVPQETRTLKKTTTRKALKWMIEVAVAVVAEASVFLAS